MEMEPVEEPEAEFLLMMETTQIPFGGGQMITGRLELQMRSPRRVARAPTIRRRWGRRLLVSSSVP